MDIAIGIYLVVGALFTAWCLGAAKDPAVIIMTAPLHVALWPFIIVYFIGKAMAK